MSNTPADIANEALDAIGSEVTVGDIEEGSREAQVCLRHYGQCLRQLLRAAHWAFARKTAPLVLLADATGRTPDVGSIVPTPWTYEYAYPIDCMKVRFIPQSNGFTSSAIPDGNIQAPGALLPVVGQSPPTWWRSRPARFVVATDYNYPSVSGQQLFETQGESPQGRTVILTDVKDAQIVYTALVVYPSLWDPLFRAAMVAFLAEKIALPVHKDKKLGLALRAQQIALVKNALAEARVADGNESWSTIDHTPDWIRARSSGATAARYGYAEPMLGMIGSGWDSLSFSDGSAY